jgi:hypothetical protein
MSMFKDIHDLIVAPIVCFSLFFCQKLASGFKSGGRRNWRQKNEYETINTSLLLMLSRLSKSLGWEGDSLAGSFLWLLKVAIVEHME